MNSYKYKIEKIEFPKDLCIDLTQYENINMRYGSCVYKLDVEKFLKEFGSLVEIVYDSKAEK